MPPMHHALSSKLNSNISFVSFYRHFLRLSLHSALFHRLSISLFPRTVSVCLYVFLSNSFYLLHCLLFFLFCAILLDHFGFLTFDRSNLSFFIDMLVAQICDFSSNPCSILLSDHLGRVIFC